MADMQQMQEQFVARPWMADMQQMQEQFVARPWMADMPQTQEQFAAGGIFLGRRLAREIHMQQQ
jgi:hypothetical protein